MIKFRNPYSYASQKYRVLDMLFTAISQAGTFRRRASLNTGSRINEIDKDLREMGYFIKRYRKEDDTQFIYFSLRIYDLFESEVAA